MGNGSSAPADHPLHEARKGKWEEYFKKMKASRKWSVNDANPKNGWTALHFAARNGWPEVIKKLIKLGAETDTKDAKGKTPLMMAVGKKNWETSKCLMNHGADVNAQDINGETPLHMAVQAGTCDLLTALVGEGANVNAANFIGWTPLHKAALLHRADEAAVLVDLGANLLMRTSNGTLASDIAANCGCQKLGTFLKIRESNYASDSNRSGGLDSRDSSTLLRTLSKRTTESAPSPNVSMSKNMNMSMETYAALDGEDNNPALQKITEELDPIFESLNLKYLLPSAAMWCVQQGAERLEDVMEDEGCVDDLADLLNLPRLKRNKLVNRLTPESRKDMLPL
uniref:Uncharacterized protein n=1 Tax=Strombidinopsis acuminata TaxID=141414 RepID=A0A7S3SMG1_9SPIT